MTHRVGCDRFQWMRCRRVIWEKQFSWDDAASERENIFQWDHSCRADGALVKWCWHMITSASWSPVDDVRFSTFLANNHQDWIIFSKKASLVVPRWHVQINIAVCVCVCVYVCRWMAGWVTVMTLWCLIRPTALLRWTLALTDWASSTLRASTNPTRRTTVTHAHTHTHTLIRVHKSGEVPHVDSKVFFTFSFTFL